MQFGLSLPFLTICLQFHSARASQRFCGKHLSDTLSLVCGGRGFFWQEDKRTGYPVVAKRYTAGLQPGDEHHFKTRGIIQECCDNPCTLMDLENYCASDDKDSLGSTVDIAELFLGKPLVDGASTADGPVTIIGDHVTHNPQLLSRLQDLRARLRQSEASQSRLASRRPFFFVRPISRRPTRINVPPVGPSMVSPNPDLNRNSFVK